MLRRGQAGPAALIASTLLFIFALLLAPATALPASAQTAAPVIDSAELRLWPEYDDPGLLVIFAGQFATGTKVPLQAAFPAPAGIRSVQATYKDASSSLINQPFQVKDGQLTYELPAAGFQIEYYLDRTPGGDQRNITYSFVAPYAINTLRVEVQQPARASSFTLTPASETSQKAGDGLTYYVFNRRNLAAGEKLDVTISYSKTDTGLSAPQLAVGATSPVDQASAATTAPAASSASVLPWILIGLGVLLLVGILVYWLLSQRKPAVLPTTTSGRSESVRSESGRPSGVRPASTSLGRSVSPVRPAASRQSGEAVIYCTNCGQALRPDDRFCSQCGAPRRP